ncbi:ArsR/SmtB family transcription factor, partial [Burkholderia multivorans]|uniref:ArsR/SmtB family transcription factor n=1 Tax=Burkholderia multivorans TaxID=87883 RepID=UPI001C65747F
AKGMGEPKEISPSAEVRSGSDAEVRPEAAAEASSTSDARDDAVFKALANVTRRRILDLLKREPLTTGAVAEAFPDLDRTTVLQHIRVLERAELLTGRKVGKTRVLALAPLPIKRIHDRWIGEYARAAVDMLAMLDGDETAGAREE